MLKDQAAVRCVRPCKAPAETFRVPLQADDGKRLMHKALRYAVPGGLDDGKRKNAVIRRQNALMVCAVYNEGFSVQIFEK